MLVTGSIVGAGLLQGFVVALVAVGFTIIYKATGIVNFANAQVMLLGGYVGWLVFVAWGQPFVLAVGCAVLAAALLGVVIDRTVIGPIRTSSLLMQIIALMAVGRIVDGLLLRTFGPAPKQIPAYAPTRAVVPWLGWSWLDVVIVGVSVVITVALVLLLFRTRVGLVFRSSADNPVGARLSGINVSGVATASWALGCGLAALGAMLVLPKLSLDHGVGSTLTFVAFAAAVLGGFGSFTGAIVGGLLIGVAQAVAGGIFGTGYEPLVSLIVMVVVLTVKPTGLVGERI